MSTITYKGYGPAEYTLPLGSQHVEREGACLDICLARAVAIDCPLLVVILIRTTGEVVLWATTWVGPSYSNTYWHFWAGSDDHTKTRRPTEGQLLTLEKIFLGLVELPGGLKGALGGPVAAWAFAGQTPAAIAAKHSLPTPFMNG